MTLEYREPIRIGKILEEFFNDLKTERERIKENGHVQDKDKTLL